jgi:hypothetical protein
MTLERKTALKRSYIKRKSVDHLKTKPLDRDIADARREYVSAAKWCQVCGDHLATDCHEITRGSNRGGAVGVRAAWLALCRRCHDALGDYSIWPVVRQYALKQIVDPIAYDRLLLNRLRGRAPDSITTQEVSDEVQNLRELGF